MTVNATQPNILAELNSGGNTNRMPDLWSTLKIGSLLALLVQNMPATETGAGGIAAGVKTLANPADVIFDVQSTAGNLPNPTRLTLLKGDSTIIPTTGQCVWDGAKKIRFAAADAVTQASIWYARSDVLPTLSLLNRALGQRDPV